MHWASQLNSRVRQHARNEPVNLGRRLNCKNVRSMQRSGCLVSSQCRHGPLAPSAKKKTLAPSRDSRRRREWISHDSGRSLSIARLPNAETSLVGVTYSTARRESFPELKGTRAWIVVPRWSWDSIESVPFRSFRRSSMLMSPSPRLAFAASMSKPAPESLTVR